MTTRAMPATPPVDRPCDASSLGTSTFLFDPPWPQGRSASISNSQLSTHLRSVLASNVHVSEARRGKYLLVASRAVRISKLCLCVLS